MSMIKWKKDELFPTFNTLWDDFFNNKEFFNRGLELGTTVPAVNVSEEAGIYRLEVAIPGYKKEDFNINVDDNVLTISSEMKEEKEETNKKMTRKEFSYASFQRSFRLPDNAKSADIKAKYKDGILMLEIPKMEQAKMPEKKRIEVA